MDLYTANAAMYYYTYYSDTSSSSTAYSTRGSITVGYPKPKKPENDIKTPNPTLFDVHELELPEEKNESI